MRVVVQQYRPSLLFEFQVGFRQTYGTHFSAIASFFLSAVSYVFVAA